MHVLKDTREFQSVKSRGDIDVKDWQPIYRDEWWIAFSAPLNVIDDAEYNNNKREDINRNSTITNMILLNVLNCYNYVVVNYVSLIAPLI